MIDRTARIFICNKGVIYSPHILLKELKQLKMEVSSITPGNVVRGLWIYKDSLSPSLGFVNNGERGNHLSLLKIIRSLTNSFSICNANNWYP